MTFCQTSLRGLFSLVLVLTGVSACDAQNGNTTSAVGVTYPITQYVHVVDLSDEPRPSEFNHDVYLDKEHVDRQVTEMGHPLVFRKIIQKTGSDLEVLDQSSGEVMLTFTLRRFTREDGGFTTLNQMELIFEEGVVYPTLAFRQTSLPPRDGEVMMPGPPLEFVHRFKDGAYQDAEIVDGR